MKTLRLSLEYNAYPIWIIEENDDILDNTIPNNIKWSIIDSKFEKLQNYYNTLFINDKLQFYFEGFKNKKDEKDFYTELVKTFIQISDTLNNEYNYAISNSFKKKLEGTLDESLFSELKNILE